MSGPENTFLFPGMHRTCLSHTAHDLHQVSRRARVSEHMFSGLLRPILEEHHNHHKLFKWLSNIQPQQEHSPEYPR